MAEYLTRTAYGPDGQPGMRGAEPPPSWDEEFLVDLRTRGALVADDAHPHLTLPIGTADAVGAAWDVVVGHDPDDVLAATAAERVRLAAPGVGRFDIGRSRATLPLSGRVVRSRRAFGGGPA